MRTYIEQTEYIKTRFEQKSAQQKKRRILSCSLTSIAACLTLLTVVTLYTPQQMPTVESTLLSSASERTAESASPVSSALDALLPEDVVFYPLSESGLAAAKLYFDPEKTDEINWALNDFIRYYGRDVRLSDIPEGMFEEGYSTQIVCGKDGSMVYDTFHCIYQETGYDPEKYEPLRRNLRISVSKIGLLNDCIYVWPEDMKPCQIGETAVRFGYRQMSYGPYDPETHEPSGWYDCYTALFSLDGADYEVVADNLSETDFLEVICSILLSNASSSSAK